VIGFQRIARTEFHKCYWPGDLPDAAGVISENPRLGAGEIVFGLLCDAAEDGAPLPIIQIARL